MDAPDLATLAAWTGAVAGTVSTVKVGLEVFCRDGAAAVTTAREAAGDAGHAGIDVFLDLKLHDIPATVRGAALAVAHLDPAYLTVHASGGAEMIAAAVEALPGTRITAVTVLTSLDADVAGGDRPGRPARGRSRAPGPAGRRRRCPGDRVLAAGGGGHPRRRARRHHPDHARRAAGRRRPRRPASRGHPGAGHRRRGRPAGDRPPDHGCRRRARQRPRPSPRRSPGPPRERAGPVGRPAGGRARRGPGRAPGAVPPARGAEVARADRRRRHRGCPGQPALGRQCGCRGCSSASPASAPCAPSGSWRRCRSRRRVASRAWASASGPPCSRSWRTMAEAPLVVVSGPSGVGKSTVVAEALRPRPADLAVRERHHPGAEAGGGRRPRVLLRQRRAVRRARRDRRAPRVGRLRRQPLRDAARAGPGAPGRGHARPARDRGPGRPAGAGRGARARCWSSSRRPRGRCCAAGSPGAAPSPRRRWSAGCRPRATSWPPRTSSIASS